MRHTQTQALYEYWRTRRQGAPAPRRADIAPQDLAGLLGHLFILQRFDSGHHVFRLAGTALCDLFQREFREQNFLSLWRGHDVVHAGALLEAALSASKPATALARAATIEGRDIEIELSFMPLTGPDGRVDRLLGLFQPLQDVSVLHGRPIVRLALREARSPEAPLFPAAGPAPRGLVAANDR